MYTINIKGYCVVKWDKFFEGRTKEEIVKQVCSFSFNDDGKLVLKLPSYNPIILHSYSSEFTAEERYNDAVKHIFDKLKDYGYRIYKDI